MTTGTLRRQREDGSAMVACLILMLVVITAVGSLAAYVTQTTRLAQRRTDAVAALQFAEGAAVIACYDMNRALTNSAGFFPALVSGSTPYTLTELGDSQQKVYERTITSPFSNQVVVAQLWFTNSPAPIEAAAVCSATVGDVTQTATLHVQFKFGFGAAIISDSPGSTSSGVSKGTAQDGNVVVCGNKSGPTIVDGGEGLAIWANGNANIDNTYANVPTSAVLARSFGTANQIPDYTAAGSADQLFDFNRFIAVADVSGTHYTNLLHLMTVMNAVTLTPVGALEGVVVVDVKKNDANFGNLDPAHFPRGINVRGTLVFNFHGGFLPTDKIFNTATMNVNKADLSGLVPTDPKTYTTGYPPVYTDPSKDPKNVDISARGFANFSGVEDRPALMYNIGILDIHGNANICGVVYSPSFMEIENKLDGQIQYFRGSLIGGGGIYFENNQAATSVCSYDGATLDLLATSSNKGKLVVATYWE